MKKMASAALLFVVACAEAAPQSPAAPQTFAAVSGERAFEDLRQMVAIGPRPAGSAGIQRTRAFIAQQMKAIGLTVQEQPFMASTPVGQVAMVNLTVTLPGTRPERILIASHYDTKPITEFVFVGANDGGSSTALLIELARVLKDKPREYTYELVFFDGEEAYNNDWNSGNTWGDRKSTRLNSSHSQISYAVF